MIDINLSPRRGTVSTPATETHTTEPLTRFVAASRWEDLPERVRHEAKRALVNFFGTALGGCNDTAVGHLAAVLSTFAGPQHASLIGRRERMDALNAAFLNAAAGNVLDFDDTHIPTVIHPTAPVAPALFALAELRPISGPALLHAFALGVEVECRLGNAVSPAHYDRGWHITSTCGVFGAAAAVGKAIGLDAPKLRAALGAASAQSSGLVETLGSMAKSVGVGGAARGGLLAALLAEQGLTGPERPIEGPRAFAAVMGDRPNLSAVTDGLGQRWEILANTYKPYPCGVVLNPVIDACLELRRRHDVRPERVRKVAVRGNPLLAARADRPNVTTGREAQVSAQHSVAVALLWGEAGVAQFSDAAVRDPAVLAARTNVTVEQDPAIAVEAATVTLETVDRATLTVTIDHAKGSLAHPLTDAEIEAKCRALAAHGGSNVQPEPLIDALWSLDRAEDASCILRLAAPAA
jgi:2-methylcitrate dehydratase PrpD